LVFVDPWQGQIPSDLTFALLVGEDFQADIAVGRLAVRNKGDLLAVTEKIIQHDLNQLESFGWMQNILFVGDDTDNAGKFCLENVATSLRLPDSLNSIHLCLDDMDIDVLRQQLTETVNYSGASIVNYRGHGGPSHWAGNPIILSNADIPLLDNAAKPFVVVTGDCLDGNFALPFISGLGERMLRDTNSSGDPVGAAAHWGSSGLGTSDQHSEMVNNFYEGLFLEGHTAIGDAVTYAKIAYNPVIGDVSLVYSFNLQGDPAMQLYRPELSIDLTTSTQLAFEGDLVFFVIEAMNGGVYPSQVVVTDTVPSGLTVLSKTSSVPAIMSSVGRDEVFQIQFGDGVRNHGLPRNGKVVITITAVVDSEPGVLRNLATVSGTGLEAWPGNEQTFVDITVIQVKSFLPVIREK